jgi:hypothetical protein
VAQAAADLKTDQSVQAVVALAVTELPTHLASVHHLLSQSAQAVQAAQDLTAVLMESLLSFRQLHPTQAAVVEVLLALTFLVAMVVLAVVVVITIALVVLEL